MTNNKLEKEYLHLKKKIQSLEEQLLKLPEGKLICSKNGNSYKWYHSIKNTYKYIPKSNQELARKLALKKYLSLKLDDAKRKKRAIEYYIKPFISNKSILITTDKKSLESSSFEDKLFTENKTIMNFSTADHFLLCNPEFNRLLKNNFVPLASELQTWQNEKYTKNDNHPENLIHKTMSGNLVRSKSEAMIDMLLYKNQIPFRYECELQLGTNIFYPDFTIRHPQSGKYYYWEHFGMMDDQAYFKNTYSKLYIYNTFGIIPSINLITTYETQEHPLCTQEIESIIEHYFL